MHDPQTFESQLTAALQRYTADDPTVMDAAALARTIVADARARHSGGIRARLGVRWAPRFVRVVVALLLLATLAGGAVLVGSRLLTPGPVSLIPAERGVFTPTGSMTFGRELPAAVLLGDGRVAVMGGYGGRRNGPGSSTEDGPLSSIEIWDPTTGSFTPGGDLREARGGGAIAVLLRTGRVLVAGGYGSEGPVTSAEIWDPHTLASTPTGPMGTGRYDTTALLLADGRVLVVGRAFEDDDTPRTGEIWDLATGMFGTGDSIPEASYPEGTILGDGRVLILVEDPQPGADGIRGYLDAEVWDPVTGTSVPAGSSVAAHMAGEPTTTLLADGRVLIAGGNAGRPLGRTVDSAEIWDPASMTFEATGSMSAARHWHGATLLRDGRVLVAGPEDTAEVFELR